MRRIASTLSHKGRGEEKREGENAMNTSALLRAFCDAVERGCTASGRHPGFAAYGDRRRSPTGTDRQARGAAGRRHRHAVAETGG